MRSKGRKESLSDSRDLDGSYDQLTGECRLRGRCSSHSDHGAGRSRAPASSPAEPRSLPAPLRRTPCSGRGGTAATPALEQGDSPDPRGGGCFEGDREAEVVPRQGKGPGRGVGCLDRFWPSPKLTLPHCYSQAPRDTRVWCWALSAIPRPPPCTLGWHSSIPAAGSLGKTGSLHSENPSSTTVPGVFTGPSLSPRASLETSCSWMGELWDRED